MRVLSRVSRATGRPRKMVNPASAPSSEVWEKDTESLVDWKLADAIPSVVLGLRQA
jgi:hypothetical protein